MARFHSTSYRRIRRPVFKSPLLWGNSPEQGRGSTAQCSVEQSGTPVSGSSLLTWSYSLTDKGVPINNVHNTLTIHLSRPSPCWLLSDSLHYSLVHSAKDGKTSSVLQSLTSLLPYSFTPWGLTSVGATARYGVGCPSPRKVIIGADLICTRAGSEAWFPTTIGTEIP